MTSQPPSRRSRGAKMSRRRCGCSRRRRSASAMASLCVTAFSYLAEGEAQARTPVPQSACLSRDLVEVLDLNRRQIHPVPFHRLPSLRARPHSFRRIARLARLDHGDEIPIVLAAPNAVGLDAGLYGDVSLELGPRGVEVANLAQAQHGRHRHPFAWWPRFLRLRRAEPHRKECAAGARPPRCPHGWIRAVSASPRFLHGLRREAVVIARGRCPRLVRFSPGGGPGSRRACLGARGPLGRVYRWGRWRRGSGGWARVAGRRHHRDGVGNCAVGCRAVGWREHGVTVVVVPAQGRAGTMTWC